MPGDEIAGLSVVVSAEVQQAIKALEGMSRQFEDTAMVAQKSTEIQEASFVDVEQGMDSNLKLHVKHSAGVIDSLKMIGMAWTAITGAAIGGVYGLLKASSYGSLYFGQWGAIMKDVMNTAIRPLLPVLNDVTNAFKRFADNLKELGWISAIGTALGDLLGWFGDLDLKWQILIVTIGILLGATAIAGLIAILPTLGIVVGAVIAVLTGPVGIVLAITAVIVILGLWWAKTDEGKKVIGDLTTAWQKFKDNAAEVGYVEAAKTALEDFITWAMDNWTVDAWNLLLVVPLVGPLLRLLEQFGVFDTIKDKITNHVDSASKWGSDLIMNFVDGIKDVISYLIDIISGADNSIGSIITSGINGLIDSAFEWGKLLIANLINGIVAKIPGLDLIMGILTTNIYDSIMAKVNSALDWGGNLIDNLISGIGAGLPSLADAVSGITDTLSGGGGGGGGGAQCPAGFSPVYNADGTYSHCESSAMPSYVTAPGETGYSGGSSRWTLDPGGPDIPPEDMVFANGGGVPRTGQALMHGGEYVVPRSGTLVKEGGMPNLTINLTVNNGTQKDSRALADEISRILATEIRRMVKT